MKLPLLAGALISAPFCALPGAERRPRRSAALRNCRPRRARRLRGVAEPGPAPASTPAPSPAASAPRTPSPFMPAGTGATASSRREAPPAESSPARLVGDPKSDTGAKPAPPKPKKVAPPPPPLETALSSDPTPTVQPNTFFATAKASERYGAIVDAGGWPTDIVALHPGAKGPAGGETAQAPRDRGRSRARRMRAARRGTRSSPRRSSASRPAWACGRPESSRARR